MENVLAQLAVVAVFVQRAVDFIKTVTGYPDNLDEELSKKFSISLSLVISAGICVAWAVDVFAAAGLQFSIPWVSQALTGLFAGLGSNIINDLIKLLEMAKKQKEQELMY